MKSNVDQSQKKKTFLISMKGTKVLVESGKNRQDYVEMSVDKLKLVEEI